MTAVIKNGLELEYVPECMQTSELIEAAINQTESAIVFVKNNATRMAYLLKHDVIHSKNLTLFGMPAYVCSYGEKHYKNSLGCNCSQIMNKVEVHPLDEQEPNLYDIETPDPPFKSGLRRDSIDGILKEMDEERQSEINKMLGYYTNGP